MDDPRQELAELLADLRAFVEAERDAGALVFPAEKTSPAAITPPARPAAHDGQSPRAHPPRSGGPPFLAPPRRSRPPGLPRASQPARPLSTPSRPRSIGKWTAYTDPTKLPAAEGEELPVGAVGLDRVRAELGECTRCGLCHGRSNIVFGRGSPDARLVVVGEAPGFHEDRRGLPFVGPAGEMLDRMIANVLRLDPAQVYICNVVKCRPPENRDPQIDEIAACKPFLMGQLRAIQPDFALVVGRVAAQTLFETHEGIKSLRGQWRRLRIGDRDIPAIATFHPAYLLRQPRDKRLAFEDLKQLAARLYGR